MMPKVDHIVCLGSSFAAGPSLLPIIDRDASRSGQNYSHQVAERLKARLTDASVSGATLENILNQPQVVSSARTFVPQIESVSSDTDLVLITAGGNDISYIGNMMRQAIQATWIGWLLYPILSMLVSPQPVEISQIELVTRLEEVLDAVHERAPKANVLLVEYLAVVGDIDNDENALAALRQIGFSNTQIQEHRLKAQGLVDAYAQAAKQRDSWCQVVKLHQESQRSHAVGSEQPWTTGFTWHDVTVLRKAPFHPTLAGMTAAAGRIVEHLENSPKVPQ